MKSHDCSNQNRAIWGVFLILFGAVLVLKNLHILPYDLQGLIFSWPTLLFVLGVLFFWGKKEKTTGIILMGVGLAFMLPIIFDWGFHWRRLFWPIILIIIGVVIVRKRGGVGTHSETKGGSATDTIDELNIFGGGEKTISTRNFRGGKITCIFGGSELYFGNAHLAEGTHVIDLFTVFGGCTLIVPSDWDVKVEVNAVLGGVDDKRIPTTNYIVEPKKELIIRGVVLLGGCQIKSAK